MLKLESSLSKGEWMLGIRHFPNKILDALGTFRILCLDSYPIN